MAKWRPSVVVVVMRRNLLLSRNLSLSFSSSSCRRQFLFSTTTSSTSSEGRPITEAYQKLISNGSKTRDDNQFVVAKKLDLLYNLLLSTDSKVVHSENLRYYPKNNLLEKCQSYIIKLATRTFFFQPQPPKGLYIWGSVGVGKSFLMDLFYDTLLLNGGGTQNITNNAASSITTTISSSSSSSSSTTVNNRRHRRRGIRRVHFHEFMIDVHSRIHQYKQRHHRGDAIPIVALELAKESRILCFDEFQVTDIADAMILKRLFEILIDDHDTIVVATSNRPPESLYEGGINRDSFLPFLDKLHETMDVIEMTGNYDYRQKQVEQQEDEESSSSSSCESYVVVHNNDIISLDDCYLLSNDPSTPEKLQKIFDTLGGAGDGDSSIEEEEESNVTLSVPMGRTLQIPRANTNCVWIDFDNLCQQPLGSADYITLCQHYPILIVENIPQLNSSRINEARRFVTLIDALYESKTKLIGSFTLDNTITDDVEQHLFVDFETTIQSNDGDEEIAISNNRDDDSSSNNTDDDATFLGRMLVKGEGGSSSSSSTTFITTKDGNEIEWSATGRIGVSLAQLSSVKDVSFSFQRAESRLMEMKRKSWGRLFSNSKRR